TLNVPNDLVSAVDIHEHVQLTQDGSKVLLGSTSLLINTDNSGIVQIGTNVDLYAINQPDLVHPRLINPTMNSTGTVFLFNGQDPSGYRQLATAHLNPSSLGSAPAISNVSISPNYVLTQSRSTTTVQGTVALSGGTLAGVTEAVLLGGVQETGHFTD